MPAGRTPRLDLDDRALPEPLPKSGAPLLAAWLAAAAAAGDTPNPNAVALATADADGRPAVRMVLCKGLDADAGSLVFYTNTHSRKGNELAANARAAAVFHWDHAERQARVEGPIEPATDAESDAYFYSRAWESRLGAWASEQSKPVGSRTEMVERVRAAAERFGFDPEKGPPSDAPAGVIPRPRHWGGYRLWFQRVELWVGGPGRVHDRAAWTRSVELATGRGAPACGAWSSTRLQP